MDKKITMIFSIIFEKQLNWIQNRMKNRLHTRNYPREKILLQGYSKEIYTNDNQPNFMLYERGIFLNEI